MLYIRAILGKMRTDEVYAAASESVTCINIGLHASKRGTRSRAAMCWMWRSASDVCRYIAARRHARCGWAGCTRGFARMRSRPGHVDMRALGV